ncbi:hypothetical protein [Cupriavidus sp. D39]|uniref:hypothetical protein n=1 Tax=Cupriavidus sp. D39 TaxID=2997877 RepID=UPI0022706907|nr:hypothetical protein [Cupriavidus sp. D39]MCY0852852.1 hypothetical protein [Cupriavidus sp. D39]
MDLYRGVMYETFRAHVRADAQPQVIILSAQHGFIRPPLLGRAYHPTVVHATGEEDRADPVGPRRTGHRRRQAREHDLRANRGHTGIVGGNLRIRLAHKVGAGSAPTIMETSGGTGMQRSHLGQYLA